MGTDVNNKNKQKENNQMIEIPIKVTAKDGHLNISSRKRYNENETGKNIYIHIH